MNCTFKMREFLCLKSCLKKKFWSIFSYLILWSKYFKANKRNKECRKAECSTISKSFSQKSMDTELAMAQICRFPDIVTESDTVDSSWMSWLASAHPILRCGVPEQEGRSSPSGIKILPLKVKPRKVGCRTQKTFPRSGKGLGGGRAYWRRVYNSDPFGFIVPQTAFSQIRPCNPDPCPGQSPSQLRGWEPPAKHLGCAVASLVQISITSLLHGAMPPGSLLASALPPNPSPVVDSLHSSQNKFFNNAHPFIHPLPTVL